MFTNVQNFKTIITVNTHDGNETLWVHSFKFEVFLHTSNDVVLKNNSNINIYDITGTDTAHFM